MKKLIPSIFAFTLFIGLLTNNYVFAQLVDALPSKDTKDSLVNKHGSKSKQFTNLFIGFGLMASPSVSQGGPVVYGKSDNFTIGIRYKRRFTNFEAVGAYLAYDVDLYRLKQSDTVFSSFNGLNKINTIKIHNKQDLIYYAFTFGIYNRFNFTKNKGHKHGTYLDLGAYGSWNFSINYYTEDDINGNTLKDYTSGLQYPQRFAYGLYGQLGWGKFSIYVKKRLSNLFKNTYYNEPYNFVELPRYEIGLQLAIF